MVPSGLNTSIHVNTYQFLTWTFVKIANQKQWRKNFFVSLADDLYRLKSITAFLSLKGIKESISCMLQSNFLNIFPNQILGPSIHDLRPSTLNKILYLNFHWHNFMKKKLQKSIDWWMIDVWEIPTLSCISHQRSQFSTSLAFLVHLDLPISLGSSFRRVFGKHSTIWSIRAVFNNPLFSSVTWLNLSN